MCREWARFSVKRAHRTLSLYGDGVRVAMPSTSLLCVDIDTHPLRCNHIVNSSINESSVCTLYSHKKRAKAPDDFVYTPIPFGTNASRDGMKCVLSHVYIACRLFGIVPTWSDVNVSVFRVFVFMSDCWIVGVYV